MATVDAHGCILCSPYWRMPLGIASDDGVYTYTAWASALLVLLFRAMRRPPSVGRVTGKVPTLFSYIHFNTFLFNRLDMGIRAQKRKDKLPRKGLLFLMVHIGKVIKAELERQECSVTWFAKKLYCERTNVYSIFKRESIDTELLLRISIVLHRNFFMDYIEELSKCDFSSTKQ